MDIWALGILLFAMLFGQFPFRGQNDKDLYKKILKGQYALPDESLISGNAKKLFQRLFVAMDVRPTIQEVVADPWFHDYREETGFFHAHAREEGTSSSSYHRRETERREQALAAAQERQLRKASTDKRHSGEHVHESVASTGTGGANGLSHQHSSSHPSHQQVGQHSHQSEGTHRRSATKADSSTSASASGGGAAKAGGGTGSNTELPPNVREEAVLKLEKLGYQREEIFRQLKDENSHLSKLYTRFVKALNAWGK